jgi:hypothetical protein
MRDKSAQKWLIFCATKHAYARTQAGSLRIRQFVGLSDAKISKKTVDTDDSAIVY